MVAGDGYVELPNDRGGLAGRLYDGKADPRRAAYDAEHDGTALFTGGYESRRPLTLRKRHLDLQLGVALGRVGQGDRRGPRAGVKCAGYRMLRTQDQPLVGALVYAQHVLIKLHVDVGCF